MMCLVLEVANTAVVVSYKTIYKKAWWTGANPTTAPLKVYQSRTEGTTGNENCRHKAEIDHIVEGQSIVEFFGGPNPKPTLIDQTKWDSLVTAVMTGNPSTKTTPATPGFNELGLALGAIDNLQGIDARVNSMKGKIMAKVRLRHPLWDCIFVLTSHRIRAIGQRMATDRGRKVQPKF